MSSLSKEEKDLILDFYFRCGDEDKINDGRDLVASNPDAAHLYAQLEDTLTQLDHDKYEPCPENLVELTVARLKLASSSGHTQLHKLLELEQQKAEEETPNIPVTWSFRENMVKVTAMAAMLLIAATLAVPTLSNMRQKSWQIACADGLSKVGLGIGQYANEHDGKLPYTAKTAGAVWNTRNAFELHKRGYVQGDSFICPGKKGAVALNLSPDQMAKLQDFPSRKNINYSIRILCEKSGGRIGGSSFVLMSDRNPVFEDISQRGGIGVVRLHIDDKLRKLLSRNHRGKGQNLLFGDGSVQYIRVRIMGNDDIFTIKGVRDYEGRETPCDDDDTFLAP